jgi:hypothetical protein
VSQQVARHPENGSDTFLRNVSSHTDYYLKLAAFITTAVRTSNPAYAVKCSTACSGEGIANEIT